MKKYKNDILFALTVIVSIIGIVWSFLSMDPLIPNPGPWNPLSTIFELGIYIAIIMLLNKNKTI